MTTIRAGNPGFAPLSVGEVVEEIIGNPAAGVDWSYIAQPTNTNDPGEVLRILSVAFVFVTAAGGSDRTIQLNFRNVTNAINVGIAEPPAAIVQAPNTTFTYMYMPNQPFHALQQNLTNFIWLPAWWLIPGQRIQSNFGSMEATDQFSNIVIMFQRWKVV